MYKSIYDIRREFLNFFQKKNHKIIESSSLIPDNDHTLLFTNAGMNQFKNLFLGVEQPLFKRVATVQRCMRAGGKHNDLDNVGNSSYHLTFFEMLGNFSFGDYFKYDAIQFAWELLTGVNWFYLSPDKLWVTVHILDVESYDIWKKIIGLSDKRILRIGSSNTDDFHDSNNFWKMGETGPCGPCSEIFYDQGEGNTCKDDIFNSLQTCENNRYIEIWNLVFIQFDCQISGKLSLLPVLSVDTGMGLERITSILQGVDSNFSIDVFKNLVDSISKILLIKKNIIIDKSLYVISDHIRACVFLIRDGVIPNNVGQGYVLRRIIRRAICHGKKLGIEGVFLYKLVSPVIQHMSYIVDVLLDQKNCIESILLNEEKLFENTLKQGLILLEKTIKTLQGNMLDGMFAFRLYDTYGFPLELTKDICRDRNIIVDQIGFDRNMEVQKNRKRKINCFSLYKNSVDKNNLFSTFVGYKNLSYQSKIIALFHNNQSVDEIPENVEGIVILDITPFYGESGGQIGDSGQLKTQSGSFFDVLDTKKYQQIIIHIGRVRVGTIKIGDKVFSQVDVCKRKNVSLNHSATHLLRIALCKILGVHILQKGSLVHDKFLRFDFSHYQSLSDIEINAVENFINEQIWNNLSVISDITSMKEAKNSGVVMLLDKKYHEVVRVVTIGDLSSELCGGTHISKIGKIGLFVIRKEYGISTGVRRIEAVTSIEALSIIQKKKVILSNIVRSLSCNEENVVNKIYELKCRYEKIKKEINFLNNKYKVGKELCLISHDVCINGIKIVLKSIENVEFKKILHIIDLLKNQIKSGVIVLINIKKNNCFNLIVKVTDDLVACNRINALDLIHRIINDLGGKGGGRRNFAQAGIYSSDIMESEIIKKIDFLLHDML